MENLTDNGELLDIFYEETQNLIDEMRQNLSALSQEPEASNETTSSSNGPVELSQDAVPDQSSAFRRLFRCAHIIRSSSRSVGLDGLEQISGALERIFKKAGDEDVVMGVDTISLLCESVQACRKLLNQEEIVGRKNLLDRLNGILQPCGG